MRGEVDTAAASEREDSETQKEKENVADDPEAAA
jgi:hypothetical protein